MNRFVGVDLGWYGKPSGLASIGLEDGALHLRAIERLESLDEIFDWIRNESGSGSAVVAVDAPLVIRNLTGIRGAERDLNLDFRRFHAGCHAANLGRPFCREGDCIQPAAGGSGVRARPRHQGAALWTFPDRSPSARRQC
jgi:predicted RNase H-like nuclease